MVKIISTIVIIVLLGSCSTMKPLNFFNNKPVASESPSNGPVKFIDDINVTASSTDKKEFNTESKNTVAKEISKQTNDVLTNRSEESANVSALQLKYAAIINTSPDQLQNKALLEGIDAWYGTRYKMGGTTKNGIDCSAFVCTIYLSAYAITLPRTARDQYNSTQRISRTELHEGDLLFFNTLGGISHVGIYLQNNKFVHASTANGVTISDMFEPYYVRKFIGAGRVKNKPESVVIR